MFETRILHTAWLTSEDHQAMHRLLGEAFEGDFGEEDYEHMLGGMHVLVREEGRLLGHGAVVMRRLLHGGRALRAGYVEGVAVRPDQRRRGIGSRVMAGLEPIIRSAYELGALSTTDQAAGFYGSRGWRHWDGTASVMSASGVVLTPEELHSIMVLPVTATLRSGGDLACDWRDGDVW